MKVAIVAALLTLSATDLQAAETAVSADLGPWQMMEAQTHDDLPGASQVYLLNTKTGTIMVCRFQPSAGVDARGCYPMLVKSDPAGPLIDRH